MFRRLFTWAHTPSTVPQHRQLIPEAEIREYVEAELEQALRDHPDLNWSKGEWYMHSEYGEELEPNVEDLFWTIHLSGSDYIVEARVEQDELLIWFGYSSAGGGGVHQNMPSAVHLSLASLKAEWSSYPPVNVYPLSAVLERMLRWRGKLHDITYPPNNRLLT